MIELIVSIVFFSIMAGIFCMPFPLFIAFVCGGVAIYKFLQYETQK